MLGRTAAYLSVVHQIYICIYMLRCFFYGLTQKKQKKIERKTKYCCTVITAKCRRYSSDFFSTLHNTRLRLRLESVSHRVALSKKKKTKTVRLRVPRVLRIYLWSSHVCCRILDAKCTYHVSVFIYLWPRQPGREKEHVTQPIDLIGSYLSRKQKTERTVRV